MDSATRRSRLQGCYVTIPTMFRDPDLEVDLDAIRRHVRFLIDGGLTTGQRGPARRGSGRRLLHADASTNASLVAEAVVDEAAGRVPIAMGGQTTSTRELVQLAKAAERIGADYLQVSPPFYFEHTEGDFEEHILAAAGAADVGLIVYNTFWTSLGHVERDGRAAGRDPQRGQPQVVDPGHRGDGLRADRQPLLRPLRDHRQPDALRDQPHPGRPLDRDPRRATTGRSGRVGLWQMLERGEYAEAQREMVRVAMPFMALWSEMESFTSGDGYLDKLCMELVGLDSSRSRPPTRDVRPLFREQGAPDAPRLRRSRRRRDERRLGRSAGLPAASVSDSTWTAGRTRRAARRPRSSRRGPSARS